MKIADIRIYYKVSQTVFGDFEVKNTTSRV